MLLSAAFIGCHAKKQIFDFQNHPGFKPKKQKKETFTRNEYAGIDQVCMNYGRIEFSFRVSIGLLL